MTADEWIKKFGWLVEQALDGDLSNTLESERVEAKAALRQFLVGSHVDEIIADHIAEHLRETVNIPNALNTEPDDD